MLVVSAIGNRARSRAASSRAAVFSLTQPPGVTATMLRLGSNYSRCPKDVPAQGPARARRGGEEERPKASRSPRQAREEGEHKVVNQVFGTAHGQFTTRGHYATAADEGTGWRTADRCDGTLIAVSAGKVIVTDRVRHRTVVVTAGHHYLAQPPRLSPQSPVHAAMSAARGSTLGRR